MEKTFSPETIERKWYDHWQTHDLFAETNNKDGTPFCIMLPPPNVTGHLHMGHAFQQTVMDILCRYKRMHGCRVLWQCGTDHAGIATQMVVERRLAAQGIERTAIGRDAFTKAVWEWKHESGNAIAAQMQRLGVSVDWSRERFTMDAGLSEAVTHVFIKLYKDGLIYRGNRLVNWDPVLQTAISDLEVEHREEDGTLYYIRYPVVESDASVTVATTRPETMLGDTAVAVHPDDERYTALIGRSVQLPLTNRTVPIIADDTVARDFGTGCVKITPAHDHNDYAIGMRHGLACINIFTPSGMLNDAAPPAYRGLDAATAREAVIADITENGFLEKRIPHRLTRPYGDRSGAVVEPYLTDQWFVRTEQLAQRAQAVVENGDTRFVPSNWRTTYDMWLENIEDWCISRQLWWGHRIPAWYDDDGNIFVAENKTAADAQATAHHGRPVTLRQDDDVLDTWFSSALWPFSTLGWPNETKECTRYYPTSVLVTGFDIIFFWVARMVMMGLYCLNDVPFRDVYITGLIRDEDGKKMSKSKGNVIDPLDVIDGIAPNDLLTKRTHGLMQPQQAARIAKATQKQFPDGIAAYGTDALRFSFATQASFGRDICFQLTRVGGYRNFCNKLWNAARYVRMQCPPSLPHTVDNDARTVYDRWIISTLQHTEATVCRHIDTYRIDLAAETLYEFVWKSYCDWYVECNKAVLATAEETTKTSAQLTLAAVLEAVLRLLHPFMPFITEEIWQYIAPLCGKKDTKVSIMQAPYPAADTNKIDTVAEQSMAWFQEAITAIRHIRSQNTIAPNVPLTVCIIADESTHNKTEQAYHIEHDTVLRRVGRLSTIKTITQADAPQPAASAVVGSAKWLVPLSDHIDITAERQRLDKHIATLTDDVARLHKKLGDTRFIEKAPAHIVARERTRLAHSSDALIRYTEQRRALD